MANNYYQNNRQPQQRFNSYDAPPAPRQIVAKPIPTEFVDQAEKVMISLSDLQKADRWNKPITSTKIRKLFGLFTDLYNEVKRNDSPELNPEQLQSLTTARIRLVYECGRSGSGSNNGADVTRFVEKAELLEYLKWIGNSRENFLKFHQYFEALVAYHRYTFGDDKNK